MVGADLLPIAANLGVAGFAIWVLYKMYLNSSERLKEKDEQFIEETREHKEYIKRVQERTLSQLAESNKVIKDNTKAFEKVIDHFEYEHTNRG